MSPQELGAIVRNARLSLGLRQTQLAGAAGVGLRFLVELERGKQTAQLGKTLAVLDTLGCRIDILPPSSKQGEDR
jgi:y4mF family transcriptional regulator